MVINRHEGPSTDILKASSCRKTLKFCLVRKFLKIFAPSVRRWNGANLGEHGKMGKMCFTEIILNMKNVIQRAKMRL